MPQRHQPVNDHQSNELEKLENNLKEKTDKCSELVLCKEQLQRDVLERNEEIEKLECRIRELEQALIISADSLQKVEERRTSIVIGVKGEMPLEAQLQVEREAIDRKEKEVTNLVEQLEQFREELENKNEEVQQLHMQLEIQRKESATRLQELEQENNVLKEGIESPQHEHQTSPENVKEILLSNDQEIVLLNEQRVKSQTHLEAASYNKMIEEKNEQIKEYKSQIKCLKSDQERLKKNREEEVEKLNEVIEKLQEELSRIEQKVSVDFTSGADVAEYNKDQFADMADGKGILQPLAGDSHVTLANREEKILGASEIMNNIEMELENTSSSKGQNKVSRPSSQVFEPLQEDVRIAMQDMESELRQLQQVIKEKDSSLKQYYDQVITLKEHTQVIETLNETIERLQLELADNDHTVGEIDGSKHQSNLLYREKLILPTIEINDTDVTLLKCELEATNAELEQLKKEVENIRSSSEKIVINEVPAIKSEDRMDECHTVSIEKLSEALREKTAQHLATEALLVSVQEASQSTIHGLETQLHDIQKGAQEKDSQLQQLANTSQLRENQEMERLNDVIRSLQQNLAEVEQRTLVDSN
ncbi:uncharacterized protein LOC142134127 [Mixophyes fleayi]|uniref:uncharacterized protein LOC142134127 n=1 Tax=Mixophyes fleayi TaxID=3061075 RepID=UPI003F4DF21D